VALPHREDAAIRGLNVFKLIARPFFTGALALLPIVLTVAVVTWMARVVADFMGPGSLFGSLLEFIGLNISQTPGGAYFWGGLVAVLLIYLFGVAVEAGLKGHWEDFAAAALSRIPVIRTIYEASRRIVQMVRPRGSADLQSMTPVMCSFGGEGGTSFPAFMPTPETVTIQGIEHHVIMIPTAPVPFGGAIMCVPREWVSPLDCGIDGLFNMYMSMGTSVPDYLNNKPPRKPGQGKRAG